MEALLPSSAVVALPAEAGGRCSVTFEAIRSFESRLIRGQRADNVKIRRLPNMRDVH
jgi:hypothetical protein